MTKVTLSIGEQIDRARDGRTQTWIVGKMNDILPEGMKISEVQFSRKKKDNDQFTSEELSALNTILGTELKSA
jgi:hypothetical protein